MTWFDVHFWLVRHTKGLSFERLKFHGFLGEITSWTPRIATCFTIFHQCLSFFLLQSPFFHPFPSFFPRPQGRGASAAWSTRAARCPCVRRCPTRSGRSSARRTRTMPRGAARGDTTVGLEAQLLVKQCQVYHPWLGMVNIQPIYGDLGDGLPQNHPKLVVIGKPWKTNGLGHP
jgi:hypothetical protein